MLSCKTETRIKHSVQILQERWKTALIPSLWNQDYLFKEKQYFEETKKDKKNVRATVILKQSKLVLQSNRNPGQMINVQNYFVGKKNINFCCYE